MVLDIETKNKINECRNILVGKVPDPKAQIEQITIALIYKFMDDIDKKYESKGLKKIYFKDKFEKFSWDNLMNPKLSSDEFFNLYILAIEEFQEKDEEEDKKILPKIFNRIFKDTFIPYKDPRTLKLFLKEIEYFDYSHSEKLGDAFEYLLSIMSSQGDAGQFRTPRHIIEFIVKIIQPKENESVLDPSCGTCGFLIEAYKQLEEEKINYDFLSNNYVGYDISYDMVRLGIVNMYFHNFKNPKIIEYDTLTNDNLWEDKFDIILANPPFMTPKGGIKPNEKFTTGANRSEVLFLEYIIKHLNKKGRSGIIVPEGIIFQSANAYKKIREKLIQNGLYCVVSLPSGVFNPYSGVKTSILLIDKTLKDCEDILFVKIENDGYHLGAQRREIKENDLPKAKEIIEKYKKDFVVDEIHSKIAHSVKKEEIIKNDFNLSGDRYKSFEEYKRNWPLVELGEVCEIESGSRDKGGALSEGIPSIGGEQIDNFGKIKFDKMKYISLDYFNKLKKGILKKEDVLIVKDGATTGKVGFYNGDFENSAVNEHVFILRAMKNILPKILYLNIRSNNFQEILKKYIKGIIGGISLNIKEIKIPLPPLEVQEKIVEKIEKYQKIIDGAKMVVENYKPEIEIDENWELVKLGEVCEIRRGETITKREVKEGNIPVIAGGQTPAYYHNKSNRKGKIITCSGSGAYAGFINYFENEIFASDCSTIENIQGKTNIKFLYYFLKSNQNEIYKFQEGMGQPHVYAKQLKSFKIPLPPLEVQEKIVEKIEEEDKKVEECKSLIEIFEKRIEKEINKVWGNE